MTHHDEEFSGMAAYEASPDERCTAEASLHLGTYRCDRYAEHDGPHCIDGNAGFPLHTWTDERDES